MRFFFCLIILPCIFAEDSLTINDTKLIQCTSHCSQIIVSFSQASIFPSECQEKNNIYDYVLACGIEYRIDYDKQQVIIDFQASNNTGSLEDQRPSEFLLQTVHLGLSKTIIEPTFITRKYACNTHNDCAKKFYFNTIKFFVTEGQTQLDLLKNKLHNDSLIMGKESKRRCIDSDLTGEKNSTKCKTGLCYAKFETYEFNLQRNIKIQKCHEENRPYLFSEIEQHTPKSYEKERESLTYQCNKNVCNRQDFTDRIRNLIISYTNAISHIPEDHSITEKKGSLAIPQTISSYILLVFFFLIQLFI